MHYKNQLNDGEDATTHFSINGYSGDFNPNPVFNSKAYKRLYLKDLPETINPLEHYINIGEARGYQPNPLFNPLWYQINNPDISKHSINRLEHFLHYGYREGRNPCRHFDTRWYRNAYPEVIKTGFNPLAHFLFYGHTGKFNPNPLFDCQWYKKTYLNTPHEIENPLIHYLEIGAKKGYSPSPTLSGENYQNLLVCNAELAAPYSIEHSQLFFRGLNNKYNFDQVKDIKDALSSLAPSLYPLRSTILLPIISSQDLYEKIDVKNSNKVSTQSFKYQPTSLKKVNYPSSPKILEFHDAMLIGGSRYVISPQNYFINDEVEHFYDNTEAYIKSNFAIKTPGRKLAIEVDLRQSAWIDNGINLMHEYNANYFHFICETLPRLLLSEEANIDLATPFLLEDGLHENIYNLFNLVNVGKRSLLKLKPKILYSTKHIYQPSDVTTLIDVYRDHELKNESVFDLDRISQAIEKCKDQILTTENKWSNKKRRVFVARRGGHRGLSNQARIENELLQIGFETIYPDSLSLEAQIHIFNQCEVIVGPTGAQMTNIVWCEPNTKIYVLASNHAAHQLQMWNFLGMISNSNTKVVQGPRDFNLNGLYSVHDDYSLDEISLRTLINEIKSL
jgi:capsular polysaccharide biosynthesis protein